jgi:hypothetical protein
MPLRGRGALLPLRHGVLAIHRQSQAVHADLMSHVLSGACTICCLHLFVHHVGRPQRFEQRLPRRLPICHRRRHLCPRLWRQSSAGQAAEPSIVRAHRWAAARGYLLDGVGTPASCASCLVLAGARPSSSSHASPGTSCTGSHSIALCRDMHSSATCFEPVAYPHS